MCHRKLRTTNLLLKLDRTCQRRVPQYPGVTKMAYGCTKSQISSSLGAEPLPSRNLRPRFTLACHTNAIIPLFVNAEHWCFQSQSSCSLSSLGPGSNVTKPFFDPSGTIFLLPTHCLHDSEMPL